MRVQKFFFSSLLFVIGVKKFSFFALLVSIKFPGNFVWWYYADFYALLCMGHSTLTNQSNQKKSWEFWRRGDAFVMCTVGCQIDIILCRFLRKADYELRLLLIAPSGLTQIIIGFFFVEHMAMQLSRCSDGPDFKRCPDVLRTTTVHSLHARSLGLPGLDRDNSKGTEAKNRSRRHRRRRSLIAKPICSYYL